MKNLFYLRDVPHEFFDQADWHKLQNIHMYIHDFALTHLLSERQTATITCNFPPLDDWRWLSIRLVENLRTMLRNGDLIADGINVKTGRRVAIDRAFWDPSSQDELELLFDKNIASSAMHTFTHFRIGHAKGIASHRPKRIYISKFLQQQKNLNPDLPRKVLESMIPIEYRNTRIFTDEYSKLYGRKRGRPRLENKIS